MGNTFLLKREYWQLQVSALENVREAEGRSCRGHRGKWTVKDLTITTVLHSNLVWFFLHKRLFFFTMIMLGCDL